MEKAELMEHYGVSDKNGTMEYGLSIYQCPHCQSNVYIETEKITWDIKNVFGCNYCYGSFYV